MLKKLYYCEDCNHNVEHSLRCNDKRYITPKIVIARKRIFRRLEKRCTGFKIGRSLNGEDIRKNRRKKKDNNYNRMVNRSR